MTTDMSKYEVNGGEGAGGEYVSLSCKRETDGMYGFMDWPTAGYSYDPPNPTLADLIAAAEQHEKEKHS